MMSPACFRTAWTDYQNLMLERLNYYINGLNKLIETLVQRLTLFKLSGSELEGLDIKATVTATARDPLRAAVFNYASMAYNNQFFFNGLVRLR